MSDYKIDTTAFGKHIDQFLNQCVTITKEPSDKVNSVVFYQAFKQFAATTQADASYFGKAMKYYGISRNKRNYLGVKLL
jgi:hypothetical protein